MTGTTGATTAAAAATPCVQENINPKNERYILLKYDDVWAYVCTFTRVCPCMYVPSLVYHTTCNTCACDCWRIISCHTRACVCANGHVLGGAGGSGGAAMTHIADLLEHGESPVLSELAEYLRGRKTNTKATKRDTINNRQQQQQ